MTTYERAKSELLDNPRVWLITGVAGFIGSNLAESLLRLNQRVIGLDNFAMGKRINLEQVRAALQQKQWSQFTLIEGDIRDLETCRRACDGDAFDAKVLSSDFPQHRIVPSKEMTDIDRFSSRSEPPNWDCLPAVYLFTIQLICGEPLAASYAQVWQEAAPNSILENLYGPTETTIAISHYRWKKTGSSEQCMNGIVPIGRVFDRQRCSVIDGARKAVPVGVSGELCLCGSQVTTGYWNEPKKSQEQFVRLPRCRGKSLAPNRRYGPKRCEWFLVLPGKWTIKSKSEAIG